MVPGRPSKIHYVVLGCFSWSFPIASCSALRCSFWGICHHRLWFVLSKPMELQWPWKIWKCVAVLNKFSLTQRRGAVAISYIYIYIYIILIHHIIIYIYMGAARFPGPPNLHDLQNWFKQLILQLPICICIVQHVTWEIGLPSFIETVQGVRSAPHRSFTLHKVFQRLVKENKEE